MIAIMPDLDSKSTRSLYLQLFDYIRDGILTKKIVPGDKLPSLRNLSDTLGVSLTTIDQAYAQLLVEGYIYSKPQAGYFVKEMYYPGDNGEDKRRKDNEISFNEELLWEKPKLVYDLNCFDFAKWKKCINKVFNEYPEQLLFESDSQGEIALRYEISKYVFQSRGVKCTPEQIVIGAGTQQITSLLSTILKKINIKNISVEEPGYVPVINIFKDRRFAISHVPIRSDGIDISKLPTNIRSAVYVNPSNQFPTGAVMPASKRYQLLDWANENKSYIIEDDYDSELRYFGKPVPALQGLAKNDSVVYLGSFSSTLFTSFKISYMILPRELGKVWGAVKNDFSQTCSKTEQLALAIFMSEGRYQTGIKKLRKLYGDKLQIVTDAFEKNANSFIKPLRSTSGINMIIEVNSEKPQNQLVEEAKSVGLHVVMPKNMTDESSKTALVFYYNSIPIDEIKHKIVELIKVWES